MKELFLIPVRVALSLAVISMGAVLGVLLFVASSRRVETEGAI